MHGFKIFSAVMAYLRLSGAMLGTAINDLLSGLNFVIAVFILSLGHATNLLLSVLSGVIHGMSQLPGMVSIQV